jgi:hypothetical protein
MPYGPLADNRLWHAHDDLYFGDSKESVGLQMADLCNYFVWRHLCGKEDDQGFYKMFAEQIICAKAEPEWAAIKDMARCADTGKETKNHLKSSPGRK